MRWASETSRKSAPSPSKLHGTAHLDDRQARLVVAVEELVPDLAALVLVGQLQGLSTEPLDRDDRDGGVGQDAADAGIGLKFLEFGHALPVHPGEIGSYPPLEGHTSTQSGHVTGGKPERWPKLTPIMYGGGDDDDRGWM